MALDFRRRSTLRLPLALSVSLMALNVALMVCWIWLLAHSARWTALTIGVAAFTLILGGLFLWLVLTIKEIRLNHRQANFVDSVTHELKSPIAALKLYLETLRLRTLDEQRRQEFHDVMRHELDRLDQLISQLLEVGRLDAVGENAALEMIPVDDLLRACAATACAHHRLRVEDVFTFRLASVTLRDRRIVLEMIFSNLLDNAVKYGGEPPHVEIDLAPAGSSRVKVRVTNDGPGIPYEDRRKIFGIFYRGGSELHRRRKGTGLGLYIVSTLVRRLKGRVNVLDRTDGRTGVIFEVDLPHRVDLAEEPAPQGAPRGGMPHGDNETTVAAGAGQVLTSESAASAVGPP